MRLLQRYAILIKKNLSGKDNIMIAYLVGLLTEKQPTYVLIECAGVGYAVMIPLSTYDKLPSIGSEVKLLIHYSFNETDGVRLFGFISKTDRDLFKKLISISKIGPKTGLSILSTLSADELICAIDRGDVKLISTCPGIGKKSAERLIIELKDKVSSFIQKGYSQTNTLNSNLLQDAEDALLALGYKQIEITKAIRKFIADRNFQTSEEIVKTVIKELYKTRKL